MTTLTAALPPREARILELMALKEQIKQVEAQAADLQQALIDDLFSDGALEYSIPGIVKVAVQNRRSSTISKELLIAYGVAPDVVQAATKETVSAPFLRLYPVKAGE